MNRDRTNSFTKIHPNRLFEGVLDQVRDAILAGKYRPGDRLPTERELAATFGVSRTSVREALRILELSDMVRIRQGRNGGIFVAEAPTQPIRLALHTLLRHQRFDIRHLFATRIFLEERAAEEAARIITDDQLAGLLSSIEQCEQMLDDGARPVSSPNFHASIVEVLDNPLLDEIARGLTDIQSILRDTSPLDVKYERAIVAEHRGLFEALRSHNAREAGLAMVRHLKTVETFFLRSQPPRAKRPARQQDRKETSREDSNVS